MSLDGHNNCVLCVFGLCVPLWICFFFPSFFFSSVLPSVVWCACGWPYIRVRELSSFFYKSHATQLQSCVAFFTRTHKFGQWPILYYCSLWPHTRPHAHIYFLFETWFSMAHMMNCYRFICAHLCFHFKHARKIRTQKAEKRKKKKNQNSTQVNNCGSQTETLTHTYMHAVIGHKKCYAQRGKKNQNVFDQETNQDDCVSNRK